MYWNVARRFRFCETGFIYARVTKDIGSFTTVVDCGYSWTEVAKTEVIKSTEPMHQCKIIDDKNQIEAFLWDSLFKQLENHMKFIKFLLKQER
jgi:hypothetical protein